MTASPPALRLVGVTKRYAGHVALDDATLVVRAGTIHVVLGENGAGKTTMMRIAFGMLAPDAGHVEVRGRAISFASAAGAIAAGIGMVHQHFTLVPAMTVAENLALGGAGAYSPRQAAARVRTIAERTGFALDPTAVVDTLPLGAQQRAEIAKALARDATLLVLDEPTAVLAPDEAADLLRWLRRFADEGGAVILVTHKLREALAAADDLTVLRAGRVVFTGPRSSASAESLTLAMLGDTPNAVSAPPATLTRTADAVIFRVEGVTVVDDRGSVRLRDATFAVHAGEIVGVAGVEGAGHRELLRVLAGRLEVAHGRVTTPARLGFIPEDRHRDAVLLDRVVAESVALRGAGRRRGRMRWTAIRARSADLLTANDVRGGGVNATMRSLSGGNQQKLVLARELVDVDGIVAENPARGLDVRATAEVHARLRAARDAGVAVVVYSSDLDEVLGLATRLLVVHAGTVREVAVDRRSAGRALIGAD